MKIRVIKIFGREVLRIESHEQPDVGDFVREMVANRMRMNASAAEFEEEELIECECCGEMFDPAEAEEQIRIDDRFEEIAENLNWGDRLVWDVKTSDDEDEA